MRRFLSLLLAGLTIPSALLGPAFAAGQNCEIARDGARSYAVCRFNPATDDVRLYLNDASGKPYGSFRALKSALESEGKRLVFAMNGGMYHEDFSPVGLYVEGGRTAKSANTNKGPGNFHMLPNGIFWIGGGKAGVLETEAYLRRKPPADFATQSGPMLLIDGKRHARFLKDSNSAKKRNGVCVTQKGEIVFAVSEGPVTFWEFSGFFKDRIGCDNALFLDGSISSLYAPELRRADGFFPLGPIIAVTAEK
ncbi:phosphodiester glycosidase family protein [Afifella marina]|uniref:Uncharacterized protein YigE, DUF2233 family n=1 Tax=Afifella marina DSM 2698 TaxID=1120955 RepID=A0A1G5NSL6_AFIMA|nr:phosphodiester glycosidase family protein [Afifella marina]MBK1624737.1 hypothetical protein [Afifella marina DSM 2698]MBK1628549.1 hypothetical protein [Afifella marina]MBK5915908.1 hypothetical protein [Afifella marina]RAI20555.1 hypothetical protein CH311_09155 [Afifella marina DSM 2698]SCZ39750.1 Uncharacterized protein YigE, DUF2233 family [Afifella marina DSM 2698]